YLLLGPWPFFGLWTFGVCDFLSTPSCRKERLHVRQRARIQNVVTLQPSFSRGIHAGAHMPEAGAIVRVWIDCAQDAALGRAAPVPPVEIEPPWARVEFDDDAIRERGVEHLGYIHLI